MNYAPTPNIREVMTRINQVTKGLKQTLLKVRLMGMSGNLILSEISLVGDLINTYSMNSLIYAILKL